MGLRFLQHHIRGLDKILHRLDLGLSPAQVKWLGAYVHPNVVPGIEISSCIVVSLLVFQNMSDSHLCKYTCSSGLISSG